MLLVPLECVVLLIQWLGNYRERREAVKHQRVIVHTINMRRFPFRKPTFIRRCPPRVAGRARQSPWRATPPRRSAAPCRRPWCILSTSPRSWSSIKASFNKVLWISVNTSCYFLLASFFWMPIFLKQQPTSIWNEINMDMLTALDLKVRNDALSERIKSIDAMSVLRKVLALLLQLGFIDEKVYWKKYV